ncbi:MAG: hypothetical protein R2792_11350 [Saprospiraceae bacterium]
MKSKLFLIVGLLVLLPSLNAKNNWLASGELTTMASCLPLPSPDYIDVITSSGIATIQWGYNIPPYIGNIYYHIQVWNNETGVLVVDDVTIGNIYFLDELDPVSYTVCIRASTCPEVLLVVPNVKHLLHQ